MRLSVSEVASLLNAGEERVYDWIEDGQLPAQRIRGEYRINRTDLLEWATAREMALAPRVFADSLSGSGNGEEIFRSLLSQEYGKAMSSRGSGIADQVYREIIKTQEVH